MYPCDELKEQFYQMREESRIVGENVFLYGVDSVKKLKELEQYPEFIPCSIYWILEEKQGKLLGVLTIRHHLRDTNDKNGHISLIIRPSERGKGYGNLATTFAIEECKRLGIEKIKITTQGYNKGAIKTILNNNGELVAKYYEYDEDHEEYIIRSR